MIARSVPEIHCTRKNVTEEDRGQRTEEELGILGSGFDVQHSLEKYSLQNTVPKNTDRKNILCKKTHCKKKHFRKYTLENLM